MTVLSGPSGVGKGTVVDAVRRALPDVWVPVSYTTRAPRPGETDGVEYRFVGDADFARLVAGGELLEYDAHFDASYGTPRVPVERRLASGVSVLLEIDIEGARQVRAAKPDALLVFLAPPSFDELARRLAGRGTEDPERVRARLDRARLEMAADVEFDAVVVNDDVETAAARVVSLMVGSPPPAPLRTTAPP
ncbi:MAG TPA: guanylate kinase [Mycobacteriales bacterium]|nr:guanylate kinase [Mycobacteriales bacterium]